MTPGMLFETAIGRCALTWTGSGVRTVALPEHSDARTMARAGADVVTQAPAPIRAAAERMGALLDGAPDKLTDLAIDYNGVPPFHVAVYEAARTIGPGQTLGYGELAALLGQPSGAQTVGRALGRNPCPIVVPCHRVLAADGSMHGFSASGGIHTKRRMLEIEGALAPTLFDL